MKFALTVMISLLAMVGKPQVLPPMLTDAPQPLRLQIESVRPAEGKVRVAVFRSAADFAQETNAVFIKALTPSAGVTTLQLEIPALPPGQYVIAVYQDLNNNDRLDTNVFGIPKEPYAFSTEPPTKWRAPHWEEVLIEHPLPYSPLVVELRRWQDR